jgi:uncharacterized glyoxalase superfamily protein PhnB
MSADLTPHGSQPYRIVTLNYVSLYLKDFRKATAFYSQVFGPPQFVNETATTFGWRMGATWLTLFSSQEGNPRNTEFAIQVSSPAEVDRLHQALLQAGAAEYMAPADTVMYEPMRFSCVDDPFSHKNAFLCDNQSNNPYQFYPLSPIPDLW